MSITYFDQPQPEIVKPTVFTRLYEVGSKVIFVKGDSDVETIMVRATA